MSNDAVYFKSLTLENIKCFKEKQTIDLTNSNGEPAMWTVILGNNNTGKTTLLKILGDFQFEKIEEKGKKKQYYPLYDWIHEFYFLDERGLKIEFSLLSSNNSANFHIKDDNSFGLIMNMIYDFDIEKMFLLAYGTNRKSSNKISLNSKNNFTKNLYDNNAELINAEEWLIQTDYAAKNGAKKAQNRLIKIKQVLKDILPDVHDFKFVTNEETFASHVEVQTDFSWIRINELGYGYQSLLAWVIDLAKKMFERYPDSENPLHEPAIVLVDEIDLHLHPEWQRKIVAYLSKNFPKTQFIVTSHSPLIVQSADEVNVVVLKKEGDNVKIEQPKIENFQGWTVEEILRDLMDLDERTHSETYLKLRQDFESALEEDNYAKAKTTKDELDKILHPNSTQRKILEIQMTSLTPELAVN